MTAKPTAVAALAKAALEAARADGIDPHSVLQEVGLSAEFLDEDPETRIDANLVRRIWAAAAEQSSDPFFGLHAGETVVGAASIHIVGFTARQGPRLRDSYRTVARFSRLTNESSRITLEEGPESAVFSAGPAPGHAAWPRALTEMAIAAYVCAGRRWVGRDFPVSRANFAHAAPKDLSEYVRVFGSDLAFSATRNEVVLSNETLDLGLEARDPELGAFLERRAIAMLAGLPASTKLADLVRAQIAAQLPEGPPSLESTAGRLAMSARTLQRRLHDDHLRYSALVGQVRSAAALDLVASPGLSLTEVASMVGYRDMESFRMAFVRWTGLSPREYRKRHAKTEPR